MPFIYFENLFSFFCNIINDKVVLSRTIVKEITGQKVKTTVNLRNVDVSCRVKNWKSYKLQKIKKVSRKYTYITFNLRLYF